MVSRCHRIPSIRFNVTVVDIIIVLDSEWLATKLVSDLPSVKVITLPKSGGVSERTERRGEPTNDPFRRWYRKMP